MTARDTLSVSRLDESTARLVLAGLHRLEEVWQSVPAGGECDLAKLAGEWLAQVKLVPPVVQDVPLLPMPALADETHADLRLAGLALVLDLVELHRRYPTEPDDWVGRLALDRRSRLRFIKPLS